MKILKREFYPRKSTNHNRHNGKKIMAVMNIHIVNHIITYRKLADKKNSQHSLQAT
jgi:hypothetical protein